MYVLRNFVDEPEEEEGSESQSVIELRVAVPRMNLEYILYPFNSQKRKNLQFWRRLSENVMLFIKHRNIRATMSSRTNYMSE